MWESSRSFLDRKTAWWAEKSPSAPQTRHATCCACERPERLMSSSRLRTLAFGDTAVDALLFQASDASLVQICWRPLGSAEAASSQSMLQLVTAESIDQWYSEEQIFRADRRYRITVQVETTRDGPGGGQTDTQIASLTFKTAAPPALLPRVYWEAPATGEPGSGNPYETLTPYVQYTVPADGQRPFYRTYDQSVNFNRNYVESMYTGDLRIRLFAPGDRCALRAYAGSVLVDHASLRPSHRPQEAILRGQGITLIVIDAAETLVLSICYTPPPELKDPDRPEGEGWRLLAGPLTLPQDFSEGKLRLLFDPTEVEQAYNDWMGEAIKVCLDTLNPISRARAWFRLPRPRLARRRSTSRRSRFSCSPPSTPTSPASSASATSMRRRRPACRSTT